MAAANLRPFSFLRCDKISQPRYDPGRYSLKVLEGRASISQERDTSCMQHDWRIPQHKCDTHFISHTPRAIQTWYRKQTRA
jgi:hypothetical protein